MTQRIAFTPGEPAGIGPDLCIMMAQQQQPCELVVIADPALLRQRATQLGLKIKIQDLNAHQPAQPSEIGQIKVLPTDLAVPVHCGLPDPQNSGYVLKTISRAAKGCLVGTFSGMVTGPVHKGVINDAGISFSGHTEYIAAITGGYPVMMLATPGLRVALTTTHIPLSEVSRNITHHRLRTVLRYLHQDLQNCFGIPKPHILVCGLNPHAGENGHLGREEIEVISPVLESLRKSGIDLTGPLPADSLFTPDKLAGADAVLAMYHDQGLPVLKHLGFGQAVNITLGLPIIRTSVDHGTALDLTGTGKARTSSLEYALKIALQIATGKKSATSAAACL